MTDSTLTYLDSYCERAGDPAIWAEPLNGLTNLAFIIAAALVMRTLIKTPPLGNKVDLYLLVFAQFAIGIGSGLWHFHPTENTVLMDVIPIGIFINVYLVSALRRLFVLPWWKVAVWWVIYTLVGAAAQKYLPPDTLHGTVMYLPTFGALAIMTALLKYRSIPAGRVFLKVLAVWTLSLIFRTIDLEICAIFPIGTHFLWHSLNAWVLWRLSMVLVENARETH